MAISFVQITAAPGNGGATDVASFSSTIAAGSIIVVAGYANAGTGVTVTNDKSDTVTDWGFGYFNDSGTGQHVYVKAFLSATTGAKTVTATYVGGTPSHAGFFIYEIAGLTGAQFDKAVKASGTSTSPASGTTGTLSNAAEAAIALLIQGGGATLTAGASPWATGQGSTVGTNLGDGVDASNNNLGEHQVVAATTALNGTGAISPSGVWFAACVTFMSGGAAAPSTVDARHIGRKPGRGPKARRLLNRRLNDPPPPPDQALAPGLVTNTSTLYTPTVSAPAPAALTGAGVSALSYVTRKPRIFFRPARRLPPPGLQALAPGLYTNTTTIFTPTISQGLTPGLVTNISTLYAPTVSAPAAPLRRGRLRAKYVTRKPRRFFRPRLKLPPPGPNALAPGLVTNTTTIFTPTVSQGLAPGLVTNTNTFFAPKVLLALTGAGVSALSYVTRKPRRFFRPRLKLPPLGPAALAPGLYTNTTTIFTPTVGWNQGVAPGLVTNTSTLFTSTVTRAVVATGAGFRPLVYFPRTSWIVNSARFALVAAPIVPPLVTNTNTFYAPTAALGAPPKATGAGTRALPYVSRGLRGFFRPKARLGARVGPAALTPALFTNTTTIYTPVVTSAGNIFPGLVTNTNTLFAPTVGVGPVGVTPTLYTNTTTIYTPLITEGVLPGLVTNTTTIFAPTVGTVVGLTPALYTNTNTLYTPTVAWDIALAPGLVDAGNIFYPPAVSGGIDETGQTVLMPGGPPLTKKKWRELMAQIAAEKAARAPTSKAVQGAVKRLQAATKRVSGLGIIDDGEIIETHQRVLEAPNLPKMIQAIDRLTDLVRRAEKEHYDRIDEEEVLLLQW